MEPYVSETLSPKRVADTRRSLYLSESEKNIQGDGEFLKMYFGSTRVDWNEESGVWEVYSTYNADSRWDGFVIGGRWDGFFKGRDITPYSKQE